MTETIHSKPVVKRDGTVIVDSKEIGRIERREEATTFTNVLMGTTSTFYVAVAGDWESRPRDRRKDVVSDLVAYCEPTTVTHCKIENSWGTDFYTAWINVKGVRMSVSRRKDYPADPWLVDTYYAPGAFCPTWSNGVGSFGVAAKAVTDPELLRLLDNAVENMTVYYV